MVFPLSPRAWSIRTKSVVLAAAYLLVFSAVYAAFSVYLWRREILLVRDRLKQTADIVASEFDTHIAAGAERLKTVAQLPGLAYGLESLPESNADGDFPPGTTLHYLFFKSPVFSGGVFLLDRAGRVLWTEPPGLPWLHRMLGDLDLIAEAYRTRRSFISGVRHDGRLIQRPYVLLGVPIVDEDAAVQGLLAGVIDLEGKQLGSLLSAVSSAEGRFVDVVDQHGVVVASTERGRALASASDVSADDRAGLMQVSVSLAHAPWRVVVGQPSARALAGIRPFQYALWGIGVSLLVLASLVAVPFLNGFARSIRILTQAAETVARGDLSQPVVLGRRRDEIATLGRAFEQMRVELGHSRAVLEQRLREREELIALLTGTNEQLRAAQARLIETERFAAIGELSAAVAHGIRNPVAGIKAAAQLARLELPDRHPLQVNLEDVISEADKLERRIKKLLDFAKPFAPRPAPCRLEDIATDAVASLRGQMTARGIELVLDFDPALPTAEVDSAQIEQVLLALFSNAVEAMPTGGRIVVTGRVLASGQRLRLQVQDTGPGIPPDHLPRIFHLFFTTKSSGSGFGLAVAKRIVESHGGTIEVSSEIGKGTSFVIELPAKAPCTSGPAPQPLPA